MIILAIDPGLANGLAWLTTEPASMSGIGVLEVASFRPLYQAISAVTPDTVVLEGFETRRKASTLDAPEARGVVKLYCEIYSIPLVEQMPTTAKGFWTDDKLKEIGLYIPGKAHRRDATRHLLYYITETLKNDYYLRKLSA